MQGAPSTSFRRRSHFHSDCLSYAGSPRPSHFLRSLAPVGMPGEARGSKVVGEASGLVRGESCWPVALQVALCLPSDSALVFNVRLWGSQGRLVEQALSGGRAVARWCERKRRTFTYPSRCCSIACYVLFSVLSFLRASPSRLVLSARLPFPVATTALSHQLDHVQVVEGHKVSVAAEDVHESLGVDHGNVAVTGRRFGASDQAKFVFVLLRRVVVIGTKLLALLHLLVVQIEAVVRILNDKGVHHRDARRRA
mmetsp:Transcript_5309/g.7102  ORF Transcript_5309/g.7102 Transcript_5309/m.7102 type:complete len:253 (+) Transcript_5309:53-811(+)